MTRYKWVAARKAEGFPITMAAKVASVSRQAFHDWRARRAAGPSEAELAEVDLVELMGEIHYEMNGTYGEPRMTAELARRGRPTKPQAGPASHGQARPGRCAQAGQGPHHDPRRGQSADARSDRPAGFAPAKPDVAWVGDITYIRTGEGWLYLASVIDLGSRRLLGYSMAGHMRTELVAGALKMAAANRGGATAGVIFHGDRGCQYMSGEYRQLVTDLGMRQSVGRTGVCWDNAVAESAWSSLKRELVHRHHFASRPEARRAIFAWINTYNSRRLHSSLGYIPPHRMGTAIPSTPGRPGRVTTVTGQRGEPQTFLKRALKSDTSEAVATSPFVSASQVLAMPWSVKARKQEGLMVLVEAIRDVALDLAGIEFDRFGHCEPFSLVAGRRRRSMLWGRGRS